VAVVVSSLRPVRAFDLSFPTVSVRSRSCFRLLDDVLDLLLLLLVVLLLR